MKPIFSGSARLKENSRVLQYQDRAVRCLNPQRSCCKMARQDLVFAYILVREEPVGRLRVCPILERCGQRFPWPFTQSGKHSSQPPI